jgi:hypothetical protein
MASDTHVHRPAHSASEAALLEAISANYPQVAAKFLLPILELFKAILATGSGDVEKILIMLVVAQRTAEHPHFQGLNVDELFAGEFPALSGIGLSASSIANALQIPQETVRRKVIELIAQGLLVRQGNNLSYTSKAFFELMPIRDKAAEMAVEHYNLLHSLSRTLERVAVRRPRDERGSRRGR